MPDVVLDLDVEGIWRSFSRFLCKLQSRHCRAIVQKDSSTSVAEQFRNTVLKLSLSTKAESQLDAIEARMMSIVSSTVNDWSIFLLYSCVIKSSSCGALVS